MDKKDWKTQAHTDKFLKELWYKGEKSNMAIAIGGIMVRKWLFLKLCEYGGVNDTSEGIIEMKKTKWRRGTRKGWGGRKRGREMEGGLKERGWMREKGRKREREYPWTWEGINLLYKWGINLLYKWKRWVHDPQIVLSSLLDKFCLSKT